MGCASNTKESVPRRLRCWKSAVGPTHREGGIYMCIALFPRTKTQRLPDASRCCCGLFFVFRPSQKSANSRERTRPRRTRKDSLLGVRTPDTVSIFVPGPMQHVSSESEKTEPAQMTSPAACCGLVSQESCVFLDTTRYICGSADACVFSC